MGPDALQTQLEDLEDQMEAIEEMNKKMSEEQGRKDRDLEIKMALEDIKSSEAKKGGERENLIKLEGRVHTKKESKVLLDFRLFSNLE